MLFLRVRILARANLRNLDLDGAFELSRGRLRPKRGRPDLRRFDYVGRGTRYCAIQMGLRWTANHSPFFHGF